MLCPRMLGTEKRLAIWVMPNRRKLMGPGIELSTEYSKAVFAVSPGGQLKGLSNFFRALAGFCPRLVKQGCS